MLLSKNNIFRKILKQAVVVLIYKKCDYINNVVNYRPITILSPLQTFFELMFCDSIFKFVHSTLAQHFLIFLIS